MLSYFVTLDGFVIFLDHLRFHENLESWICCGWLFFPFCQKKRSKKTSFPTIWVRIVAGHQFKKGESSAPDFLGFQGGSLTTCSSTLPNNIAPLKEKAKPQNQSNFFQLSGFRCELLLSGSASLEFPNIGSSGCPFRLFSGTTDPAPHETPFVISRNSRNG